MRSLLRPALVMLSVLSPLPAPADEFLLRPVDVIETKALFGQVESRFVVPARSRTAGTLTTLEVTEGSQVEAGQVIARVVDDKLELQLAAAEARIRAAQSQLTNARSELARNEALLARGAATTQRVDQIRVEMDVATNALTEADSARSVIRQQMQEGDIVVPSAGRVLTVPARLGEVLLAGEPVATIAGGGVFLRLAIPERHAPGLAVGVPLETGDATSPLMGRIEKIYPLIEAGRVIADVAVEGLSDSFIGQRVLVRVPVGTRAALAVPDAALRRSAGLDQVVIATDGAQQSVTVVPGALVATPDGPRREILSGLRDGDRVMLP